MNHEVVTNECVFFSAAVFVVLCSSTEILPKGMFNCKVVFCVFKTCLDCTAKGCEEADQILPFSRCHPLCL